VRATATLDDMGLARAGSRNRLLLALALLLAVAASGALDFVHTDDGCAVERHCRACRVALAFAGAAPPSVPTVPVAEAGELLASLPVAAPHDVAVSADGSRAPPFAL
jgi:hypothetical protein